MNNIWTVIIIVMLIIILITSWIYLGYDNPIEEAEEKILKEKTGIDIDFSPQNNYDPDNR